MSLEGVDKDRREVAQGRGSGSEQVAQEGLQSRGGGGWEEGPICGMGDGHGRGRL